MRENPRRKVHQLTPDVLVALPREDLARHLLYQIDESDARRFGEAVQRAVDAWPHGDVPITWLRVKVNATGGAGRGQYPLRPMDGHADGKVDVVGNETLDLINGVVHKRASVFGRDGQLDVWVVPQGHGARRAEAVDALVAKGWKQRVEGHVAAMLHPPAGVLNLARANPDGDVGHDPKEIATPMFRASPIVQRAMKVYTLWTEKAPDDSTLWQDIVTEQLVAWDKLELVECGRGGDIVYISDKWEKPGVLERYHHPFDSGPGIFAAADDVDGPRVPLTRLLGVHDLRAPVALTLIAVCEELIVQRPGMPHLTLRFQKDALPAVCSTVDKKCVVILSEDRGPIFVRGGRMTVSARGIVG